MFEMISDMKVTRRLSRVKADCWWLFNKLFVTMETYRRRH